MGCQFCMASRLAQCSVMILSAVIWLAIALHVA